MMIKKPWAALVVLLLIMACTACQRRGVVNVPLRPAGDYANQHIQRQLTANLSIDARVSAPSDLQKLNTYLVAPLPLDAQGEALEASLIDGSEITQKNGPGGADIFIQIKTTDGKTLGVGDKAVLFTTAWFETYVQQLLFYAVTPGDDHYDVSHFSYSRDRDLPFMSRRQAVEKVRQQLSALGLSVYDTVETYALDYQSLQAQEKALKENGQLTDPKTGSITVKDNWSEKDDCYYMIFRCGLDSLPVYTEEHGSVDNNTWVAGSFIEACYSQRGWEYLSIQYPYRKIKVDREGVPVIDVEQALAAVAHKYENVILTNPITITAIELDYVPTLIGRTRDEFRMVPAWCFQADEKHTKNGAPLTVHRRVIIDATTGSEIL